jgi:hypothetical protein
MMGERQMSGFFARVVGRRGDMVCGICGLEYERECRWPTTGRCGHTICSGCHMECVIDKPTNDGQWQPCPTGGCKERFSFEVLQCPNLQLLEMMERFQEIEGKVAGWAASSAERQRYDREVQLCRQVFNESLEAQRKEIEEKDRELSCQQSEIELLQARLSAVSTFQRRLAEGTFMREGELSSEDEEPKSLSAAKNSPTTATPQPTPTKSPPPKKSRGPPNRRFRLRKVSLEGNTDNLNNGSTSEEEF